MSIDIKITKKIPGEPADEPHAEHARAFELVTTVVHD